MTARRKRVTIRALGAALFLLIVAAPAAYAAAPKTQVGFSPTGYVIGEGGGTAILTVTRSGNLATTTTVTYQTENGGSGVVNAATAPGDYNVVSGSISFTNGEKVKTIVVPVNNDTADEPNEVFSVRLLTIGNSDSTAVTFKKSSNVAKITITDNDEPAPEPQTLPYFVTGTLVSFVADNPATPANEGTVTVTVTAANEHATNSGEIADQDAGTPGVQVAGATYTVPAADPHAVTLVGYEGADTPSAGDLVQIEGTILFTPPELAPPGTSLADLYAAPNVATVTITDSDPDA